MENLIINKYKLLKGNLATFQHLTKVVVVVQSTFESKISAAVSKTKVIIY